MALCTVFCDDMDVKVNFRVTRKLQEYNNNFRVHFKIATGCSLSSDA